MGPNASWRCHPRPPVRLPRGARRGVRSNSMTALCIVPSGVIFPDAGIPPAPGAQSPAEPRGVSGRGAARVLAEGERVAGNRGFSCRRTSPIPLHLAGTGLLRIALARGERGRMLESWGHLRGHQRFRKPPSSPVIARRRLSVKPSNGAGFRLHTRAIAGLLGPLTSRGSPVRSRHRPFAPPPTRPLQGGLPRAAIDGIRRSHASKRGDHHSVRSRPGLRSRLRPRGRPDESRAGGDARRERGDAGAGSRESRGSGGTAC